MTAVADRRLPADLLYGRLLATAAQQASVRSFDGTLERLPLERWLGEPDAADLAATALAEPPVLDLGCGPGRHLQALRAAGKRGFGVDLSSVAVSIARRRGGAAFHGDLFGSVPGAGGYRTALLLDGNIGIGGAPHALLERTRQLLAPEGAALVELDPPGRPTFRTRVRLEAHGVVSEWFAWARVGVDGIEALAAAAGFEPAGLHTVEARWIAVLRRS